MNPQELKQLEDDLWRSADTLRANSDLKATEYSTPVLGLIFLKFADNKYRRNVKAIKEQYAKLKGTRREKPVSEIAIEKCGFYLPDHARYDYLLNLPEEQDIDKAIKKAMEAIEEYKPELKGTLPQDEYFRLTRTDKTIPREHEMLGDYRIAVRPLRVSAKVKRVAKTVIRNLPALRNAGNQLSGRRICNEALSRVAQHIGRPTVLVVIRRAPDERRVGRVKRPTQHITA